jgi:L-threonylcarbamoyladenylate synthase
LIETALTVLRRGGVIVFPTDTVFGIGADAGNEAAVRKIFQIKRRSADKPIPVMVHSIRDLPLVARDIPESALSLVKNHWPGPLTIVLFKAENISPLLTGGSDRVGIRIPNHPITLEILNKFGQPLAVTSANISGQSETATYEQALNIFQGQVDLILPGEVKYKGVSTVVDFTCIPPKIIREGIIKLDDFK